MNLATCVIKTFTLFDINDTLITCLIDAKVTKKLINFCESNNVILQKLSLGLVGNMLTGNDIHAHVTLIFTQDINSVWSFENILLFIK